MRGNVPYIAVVNGRRVHGDFPGYDVFEPTEPGGVDGLLTSINISDSTRVVVFYDSQEYPDLYRRIESFASVEMGCDMAIVESFQSSDDWSMAFRQGH